MYWCMREGAVWSWQSFEDQSSELRGPGTETEQAESKCSYVASGAEISAQLDKREKWGPDGA